MFSFLARRSLQATITFCVVIIGVFFATRLSGDAIDYLLPPGSDPVVRAGMIIDLGIDRPLWIQFFRYLVASSHGDFGIAFYDRRPVVDIFAERLPNTLFLFAMALPISLLLGLPMGLIAALKRGSLTAAVIMSVAFIGYATPSFVLGILMILSLSMKLHLFPSSGSATLFHFVLPALLLSALLIAEITRFTRNSMLDVMGQDYIRMARAKGMSRSSVI